MGVTGYTETGVVRAERMSGVPGIPVSGSAFSVRNMPAVNTIATASKAAPGAGKHLILTSAVFTLVADAVAPAAVSTYVYISTNATLVWSVRIALPAVAGEMKQVTFPGIIVAEENVILAAGFIAAGGANTFEAVSITGYIAQL